MKKYKYYLRRFIVAVIILTISFIIVAALITVTLPKINQIIKVSGEIKSQTTVFEETERKLAGLRAEEAVQNKPRNKGSDYRDFYKPIDAGADTESIMAEEIANVLKILKNNHIKTRSISYEYDAQWDNFVKNASDKYSSCALSLDIVADYRTFLAFLRDLYKHEHFVNINKIEIVPYNKNKKILLINTQIVLYAQKALNYSNNL
ncbi:MAG: hypothetical protein LBK53_04630 [Heliobacteriaceae bacterium]|nr:hypothetical protein [Heliobacteriaceae bacterium]